MMSRDLYIYRELREKGGSFQSKVPKWEEAECAEGREGPVRLEYTEESSIM